MKARSKELLDRAIAATVAAIEIYNKPDFLYREEAFAVLAINGWELLLKAKWLADHNNQVRSLYVMEPRTKLDGTKSKKLQIKLTRSRNPFTQSLDFFAKKLVESGDFHTNAWANIQALLEMRDSSIHFYNRSGAFPVRLQEIGTASLKNFVAATKSVCGKSLESLFSFGTESMNHKIDHGQIDHVFTACRLGFVVAAQSSVSAQPRECSFNDPSVRQNLEAGNRSALDDLQRPAREGLDP